MHLRAYIFCEFSVARIECATRLIIHRGAHIWHRESEMYVIKRIAYNKVFVQKANATI